MTIQMDERCCLNEILQTWCHRDPAKTPPSLCMIGIRVEEYFHCVGFRCDGWWLEVPGRRWIRVAAAVVHQGCPVPICDLDKVGWAGGDIAGGAITSLNSKVGELQPQYLPTLHFYGLCFVEVVRIVVRVVW